MIAQTNSTKELELEDVMKFAWDDEEDDMTQEQKERMQMNEERELKDLRERAKRIRL